MNEMLVDKYKKLIGKNFFFVIINVSVRINLHAPRLISQLLKLTIM
jgi:hypothetical protein